MRKSVRLTCVILLVLLFAVATVWYAVLREDRRGLLTVSFLDIGQGDAIFIDAPSGRQVLIDGGPGTAVLRQLATVMPWYDHSIDVVIPTHPDADHITGLIDVLARYRIGTVIQSSVLGSTATWNMLEKSIGAEGAQVLTAARGQIVELGSTGSPQAAHAYLEILYPDRPLPHVETNDGSVVARLVYGDTSFMLTGDASQGIENYLVRLDGSTTLATGGSNLKSDVLKAGHHGSKTSSSPLFLGYVAPAYAVFSRGCDNSYGHPAPETLARFAQFGIPTLDTCEEGTITFVSDGQTVTRK